MNSSIAKSIITVSLSLLQIIALLSFTVSIVLKILFAFKPEIVNRLSQRSHFLRLSLRLPPFSLERQLDRYQERISYLSEPMNFISLEYFQFTFPPVMPPRKNAKQPISMKSSLFCKRNQN